MIAVCVSIRSHWLFFKKKKPKTATKKKKKERKKASWVSSDSQRKFYFIGSGYHPTVSEYWCYWLGLGRDSKTVLYKKTSQVLAC